MAYLMDKVFLGTVLPIKNELDLTKVAVNIPELQTLNNTQKTIYVDNTLTNNLFTVNTNTNPNSLSTKLNQTNSVETHIIGNYFPLLPGTDVYIKFKSNVLSSGYIVGFANDINRILPEGDYNQLFMLAKYDNNTVYMDPSKKRFHVSLNGESDLFMDDQGIILQVNENKNNSPVFKSQLELNKNGFRVKVGEKELNFNTSGFSIGNPNSDTQFIMTDKGFNISGEKYMNISTHGNLNIYGESTHIQGEGEMSVRGTITKLTGHQKISMNGAIVHVRSWLDTHIKSAMNLTMESLLKMEINSSFRDDLTLGIHNSTAAIQNSTTALKSNTSVFESQSVTTHVADSMSIKDLGIGSSTSSSVGTSANATMLGTKAAMIGFTGIINIDNIGPAIASAIMNDTSIGDTATAANSIGELLIGNDNDIFNNFSSDTFITQAFKMKKDKDDKIKQGTNLSSTLQFYNKG